MKTRNKEREIKGSKQALNKGGVRVIIAYLLGNLNDRFLQNKSKRKKKKKRKEMYICKLKSKKKKKQMKMSKWLGCPGHSNNQSEVIWWVIRLNCTERANNSSNLLILNFLIASLHAIKLLSQLLTLIKGLECLHKLSRVKLPNLKVMLKPT